MSDEKRTPFYKVSDFWQYAVAGAALAALAFLAKCQIWPFGTRPPDLGEEPSVFEVLLNDRLMIGFVRAAVVAVVGYVIVSVPALIVDRRWMKGLSTAGIAADEVRKGDRSIQELQDELATTQEELENQLTQNEIISQLLLELEAEQEDDSASEEGGANGTT